MEMQRVLLLLGTTRDAKLTCELLERNAIASHACGSAEQLRAQIDAGAGAVLVAEECLDSGAHSLAPERCLAPWNAPAAACRWRRV